MLHNGAFLKKKKKIVKFRRKRPGRSSFLVKLLIGDVTVFYIKFGEIIWNKYYVNHSNLQSFTQKAITCSKLTIETLEQDVKYVQLTIKTPE